MNPDVSQEELLSAYLDGELTAAERAEVERLLADSPQARQLLEELRALSSALQAVPRHKLGEDLGPQVLRLAEREMLLGKPEAPRPAAPPRDSRLRRMLSRRALLWSGLAVAVAIVLMISDLRHSERRLAMSPATAPKSGKAPRMQAAPRADEARPRADEAKEEQAGREVQPSAPPAMVAADRPAAEASAERGHQSKPLVTQEPLGPLDVLVTTGKGTLEDSSAGARPDNKPAAGYGTFAGVPESQADNKQRGAAAVAGRFADAQAPQFAGGVLVVQCEVHPEAARKQAFAQLLTDNHIAWEEPPPQAKPATEEKKQPKKKNAVSRAIQERQIDSERTAGQSAGDLELVYVEAAADRIQATLNQLAAQPEEFPAISVESVPGIESQWDFGQYNRFGKGTQLGAQSSLQYGSRADGSDVLAEAQQAAGAKDTRSNVQSASLGRAQRIAVGGLPSALASQLRGQLEKTKAAGKPAENLAGLTPRAAVAQKPAEVPADQLQLTVGRAASAGAAIDPQSVLRQKEKAETAGGGQLAQRRSSLGVFGQPRQTPGAAPPADQPQQSAPQQSQQIYRVLFVLRVVEANAPARRAGAAQQQAIPPADAPARPEAK